jgi:hypothetical protein
MYAHWVRCLAVPLVAMVASTGCHSSSGGGNNGPCVLDGNAQLEVLLRLSVLEAELFKLTDALGPDGAKIVRYAARILNLLRTVASVAV